MKSCITRKIVLPDLLTPPNLERRCGFTLIELLTVIFIIGVLAAILIPVLSSVRQQAAAAETVQRLRSLGSAFGLYINDNQGDLPASGHPAQGGSRWPFELADYIDLKYVNQGMYKNPVFRDAFQDETVNTGGAGVFGYNIFFTVPDSGEGQRDPYSWRKYQHIEDPAKTPLLCTTDPISGGGLHMNVGGPNALAEAFGYQGSTKNNGPAPTPDGRFYYLMADFSVYIPEQPWPWSDTRGTDFHPKHDLDKLP